jgi:hypothetical protein
MFTSVSMVGTATHLQTAGGEVLDRTRKNNRKK